MSGDETQAALQAIWTRHREGILGQISILERAVAALVRGTLDDELRTAAEREAHKLAGSLGTFGFVTASERAREVELALAAGDVPHERVPELAELVVHLRGDVQEEAVAVESTPALPADSAPLLLLVEDDRALADGLAVEAERRGMAIEVAASPAEGRSLAGRVTPDAVLLDLVFDGETAAAYELLSELTGRSPPVPVLVFSGLDTFTDRVEVARRGGSGFVHKSLLPQHAIDQVAQLIEHTRASDATVLAVDDDVALLAAVRALLEPEGYRVATLDDPLRFWEELERVRPDIVLLDVDMPAVGGIELCRVLRNDARWAATPVLFLTARQDTETVQAIFAARADDYLVKPLVPQELLARIRSRRERFELHRALAERDSLTGVANRRASVQALNRLLRLSRRFKQPLTIAELDLDHFKEINDRYGHGAGDAVLRRLGERLLQTFRGEDVVGRWGGEEFVVGMYGMSREDAVQRMRDVLEMFGGEDFVAPGGERFHVGFSAGVAAFPGDGDDVSALHRAADEALYRAKAAGRRRVFPAGADQVADAVDPDVVVVEDDEVLGELLMHTLATHGHRARWLKNGAVARDALCGSGAELLRPRVLLLDVDLPGMDGIAVLRGLRGDGVLRHTRVIMLTMRSTEDEVVQSLELGAFDHVPKPFSLPILMHKVDRALETAPTG